MSTGNAGESRLYTPDGLVIYTPSKRRQLAEACYGDFGRLMYDGFGIMPTDEQVEASNSIGMAGPRQRGEYKLSYLSGGQRAGKTVFGFGKHAEAALYKVGVDPTDSRFWRNYTYKTLHVAPSDELALRLWTIGDEISKGSNDAQYDTKIRHSRGGHFIGKFKAGQIKRRGVFWWDNGSVTDFYSTEGWAFRLEGGQWWWVEWDEWMSQNDREIKFVRDDVLLGRARDHDAKIMPMAWPKPATERHLIEAARKIDAGEDEDSQVVYLSSDKAFFTNRAALAVELRTKTAAQISRTIYGVPAGGAAIVFKPDVVANMIDDSLPLVSVPRETGYVYLSSADVAVAHDANVRFDWRIPMVNGKAIVHPTAKARIVGWEEIPGSSNLTLDSVVRLLERGPEQYGGLLAVDATAMGGLVALRAVNPTLRPLGFVARSNDRVHGNMRNAAIANGLNLLTMNRTVDAFSMLPWGCIEAPRIVELVDQLANFDPDDKKIADDWVWAFLIGLWYIKRFWLVEDGVSSEARTFDPRPARRTSSLVTVRPRPGNSPVVSYPSERVVFIPPPKR